MVGTADVGELTVTLRGVEAVPFAMTTDVDGPVSAVAGTSN